MIRYGDTFFMRTQCMLRKISAVLDKMEKTNKLNKTIEMEEEVGASAFRGDEEILNLMVPKEKQLRSTNKLIWNSDETVGQGILEPPTSTIDGEIGENETNNNEPAKVNKRKNTSAGTRKPKKMKQN